MVEVAVSEAQGPLQTCRFHRRPNQWIWMIMICLLGNLIMEIQIRAYLHFLIAVASDQDLRIIEIVLTIVLTILLHRGKGV